MDILRMICDRYPAFKPYFKGHNMLDAWLMIATGMVEFGKAV